MYNRDIYLTYNLYHESNSESSLVFYHCGKINIDAICSKLMK